MCIQSVFCPIQGAADWCGRKVNCPIARDPTTKRETQDGNWAYIQSERRVPRNKWRSTYIAREKVSIKIPVYMTEGHYDDYGEELMEYVRGGGGLIGNLNQRKPFDYLLRVIVFNALLGIYNLSNIKT